MIQCSNDGWVSSSSLAVHLPDGVLDFGDVIDSASPGLARLRVRSLLPCVAQLCFHQQASKQPSLSIYLHNPNIDLDLPLRLHSFNMVDAVSNGDIVALQADEERELVVSLHPGGFTGRGTGLQRFCAFQFRSTLSFTLDGHMIEFAVCARICRSQIAFSVRELLVDCHAGTTEIKTISVHNFSEMATLWSLSVVGDNDDWFSFADALTGAPIQPMHHIAGFSEVVVRISLSPDHNAVEESPRAIVLENVLDARNTDRIPVYFAVMSEIEKDGLQLSNTMLDFGDCLAGEVNGKSIHLKNTTRAPVEIFLSSNVAKPDRIWFVIEDALKLGSSTNNAVTCPNVASQDESTDFNIPLGGSATSLRASSFSRLPSFSRDIRMHFRKQSTTAGTSENDVIPSKNTVEELTIAPGRERQIRIQFLSAIKVHSRALSNDAGLDPGTDYDVDALEASIAQLSPFKARVFLKCRALSPQSSAVEKYFKSIQCLGRVCTSLITAHPLIVDFGEIPLLIPTFQTFTVENLSDMPTSVLMEFESKVLTVNKNPVDIAACSKVDVRLKLVPQKRATLYQKEIQLSNLRNPHDNRSLMVLSKNVDRFEFHSHTCFYDVNIDNSVHSESVKVDFGKIVTNCPVVRVFKIRNNTAGALKIQLLSASAEDVSVYCETRDVPHEEIQLASLVSHEHPDTSPWFPDVDEQRVFVEHEIQRLKYFKRCLQDGLLVNVDQIELTGEQTLSLLLVYCLKSDAHPHLHGKLKNLPAKLNLHLVAAQSFDDKAIANVPDCIVHLQAMVCRTSFHFALKHINFGILNNLARRHFNLVISNTSDISVQYCIIKTRSIASDDLDCPLGYTGILRPYQIREIPIIFKPCLAGRFLETLTFINVQDCEDKQVICVKADIKKPYNFWVQTVVLDFGYCLLGERTRRKRLLIKNISERTRRLCVKVDSSGFPKDSPIVFEPGDLSLGPAISNVDRDEEREKLEGKLRIAERKGQKEKIQKIRRRLSEIRQELASDSVVNDSELKQDEEKVSSSNSLILTLPANAVQNVFVTFNSEQLSSSIISLSKMRIEVVRGTILVYENKNKDYIRDLSFWAYICKDNDVYQKAITGIIPLLSPFSSYWKKQTESAPRPTRSRARNQSRSASSSPVRRLFRFPLITANDLNGGQKLLINDISGVSIQIPSDFVFHLDDNRIIAHQTWQTVADGFARRIVALPIPSCFIPGQFSLPLMYQWPFVVISPTLRKGSISGSAPDSTLSVHWVCDDLSISESIWFCISVVDRSFIQSADVADIPFLIEGGIIELGYSVKVPATQPAIIRLKSSDNVVVSMKWHSDMSCPNRHAAGPITGLLSLTALGVTQALRVAIIPSIPCLSIRPSRLLISRRQESILQISNICKKPINLVIFPDTVDFVSFSNGIESTRRLPLYLEPDLTVQIIVSHRQNSVITTNFPILIRDLTTYQEHQIQAIILPNS